MNLDCLCIISCLDKHYDIFFPFSLLASMSQLGNELFLVCFQQLQKHNTGLSGVFTLQDCYFLLKTSQFLHTSHVIHRYDSRYLTLYLT